MSFAQTVSFRSVKRLYRLIIGYIKETSLLIIFVSLFIHIYLESHKIFVRKVTFGHEKENQSSTLKGAINYLHGVRVSGPGALRFQLPGFYNSLPKLLRWRVLICVAATPRVGTRRPLSNRCYKRQSKSWRIRHFPNVHRVL